MVPAGWRAGEIVRVLVPLDGTQDTSAVLAETMRLAANGSPELVVLHVHTPTSVPAFADQSHHAQEAWDKEFLARFAPAEAEGARIVRRVGDPCVDVAAVAEEIDADVVVLGWSRRLDAGRGPVVRETLSRATVPVMLVPAP
jgi:nucleotide-binding universal stress UspA family protein